MSRESDPPPELHSPSTWSERYLALPGTLLLAVGSQVGPRHHGLAVFLVGLGGATLLAWCGVALVQLDRGRREMAAMREWLKRHSHE